MRKNNIQLTVNNYDKYKISEISNHFNISEIAAKVILNRELSKIEDVTAFLNPNFNNFEKSTNYKDLVKGTERLKDAIKNNENIIVYGDYDVDGVTSISQFVIFLREINANITYYIPDRETEGYGISDKFVKNLKNQDFSLLITVDCGISNYEAINEINKYGVDVIIIDHHKCPEVIPEAVAVINPKQKECKSRNKNLCAAGLTFKFLRELSKKINLEHIEDKLLELASLGTIADIVELKNDNRIIAYNGLKSIRSTKNIGLKKLIEKAQLNIDEIESFHIGFIIAPRINAAGRMSNAEKAVELLTTNNMKIADKIAEELNCLNNNRKEIEVEIFEEAVKNIEKNRLYKNNIIIVSGQNWHEGVIGIVASRITEKYNKPSIVISIKKSIGKASARSLSYLDMYETLNNVEKLLMKYGGHKLAAGLTIKEENIEIFAYEVNKYADDKIRNLNLLKKVQADAFIEINDITENLSTELNKLEPFGCGNPKPSFAIRNFDICNIKKIGKNRNHIKFLVCNDKKTAKINAVAFNKINMLEYLLVSPETLVVNLNKNVFNGREEMQIILQEIKSSQDIKYRQVTNNDVKKEAITKIIENTNSKIFKTEIFSLVEKLNNIYNINVTVKEVITIFYEISKVTNIQYALKNDILYIKKE